MEYLGVQSTIEMIGILFTQGQRLSSLELLYHRMRVSDHEDIG